MFNGDSKLTPRSSIAEPLSPKALAQHAPSTVQGSLLADLSQYSDQEPAAQSTQIVCDRSESYAKTHSRACTDVVFLIAFLLYWMGLLVLGVYAWTRGTNVEFAKYIRNGVDFQGNECLEGHYLYFPDFRNTPEFGICIAQCPLRDNQLITVTLPTRNDTSTHAKTLMRNVTFQTYATHTWAYICAPANGMNFYIPRRSLDILICG